MPQSVSIGLMALGGVLLLVAIIGGKFKIFGAEVSDTISSWQLRFLAGVLGIIFVLAAVFQSSLSPSSPSLPNSRATSPKPQPPAATDAPAPVPPKTALNPHPGADPSAQQPASGGKTGNSSFRPKDPSRPRGDSLHSQAAALYSDALQIWRVQGDLDAAMDKCRAAAQLDKVYSTDSNCLEIEREQKEFSEKK